MASARRKSAAIALAVVGIAGLSLASAAQLNVSSNSLGAATAVVASCQPTSGPAISVGFTNAYDVALKAYKTTEVKLTGVAAACSGLPMSITVTDTAGVALATITGSAVTGASTHALSAAIDPKVVVGVAIVIGG